NITGQIGQNACGRVTAPVAVPDVVHVYRPQHHRATVVVDSVARAAAPAFALPLAFPLFGCCSVPAPLPFGLVSSSLPGASIGNVTMQNPAAATIVDSLHPGV